MLGIVRTVLCGFCLITTIVITPLNALTSELRVCNSQTVQNLETGVDKTKKNLPPQLEIKNHATHSAPLCLSPPQWHKDENQK